MLVQSMQYVVSYEDYLRVSVLLSNEGSWTESWGRSILNFNQFSFFAMFWIMSAGAIIFQSIVERIF